MGFEVFLCFHNQIRMQGIHLIYFPLGTSNNGLQINWFESIYNNFPQDIFILVCISNFSMAKQGLITS